MMPETFAVRRLRVNGIGQLVEYWFQAYIPEVYFEMFPVHALTSGNNPCNAKPWGVPQRDCYACSLTLGGAADACLAHGFKRCERIIKE